MPNTRFHFSTLAVFLLVTFSSCRKDDPVEQNGDPVFLATGTVGSTTLNLKAGVNDYYMYSSYSTDAQSILEFSGELRKINCSSPCPTSLRVRIRDYGTMTSTVLDSSFSAGFYQYVTAQQLYTVNFTQQCEGDTNASYTWDFGDNSFGTGPNPSHTYASPGNYFVSLLCTGTCGQMNFTDTLALGTGCDMFPDFSVTPFGSDTLQFIATVSGGTAPYTFAWTFSDSAITGTGQNFTRMYNASGASVARLTVTDANGCTVGLSKNVQVGQANCLANFAYQVSTNASADYRKVTVEWVDANGTIWTSANPGQPANSTFQIISAEEYLPNENDQATKKIHLLVNCTLYNGTNSILLQNADLVFAFAHP
jgi:PKD repeat protein